MTATNNPNTAHQRLIDYLAATYGDNLLRRNGETYPVYVYPPAPSQRRRLDSILSPQQPANVVDAATYAAYDQEHLEHLRRTRHQLTNGITYVLQRMETDPLRIDAGLSGYFDMLATCAALDDELRAYAQGERQDLPRRDRLHALLPPEEVLTDGRGRSAAIGGAVLTVFNDNGTYRAILARRSMTLGTGAGMYHLVPAFMFQPTGPEAFHDSEWSLIYQILREFGEELFAMPEYHETDSPDDAYYFYDHPAVADLRTMLEDGRATLELTGMAINPMSTRPEVCALLVIHDPEWYARSKEGLAAALLTERQETRYIPVDTLEGLPDDLPIRMTPQGAASFWLGIDQVRSLLSSGCSSNA